MKNSGHLFFILSIKQIVFSPFSYSSLKHFPAIFSLGSFSKAMCFFSLPFFGLVCSLCFHININKVNYFFTTTSLATGSEKSIKRLQKNNKDINILYTRLLTFSMASLF